MSVVVWEKSFMISAGDNVLLCPKCSIIDQETCEHDK